MLDSSGSSTDHNADPGVGGQLWGGLHGPLPTPPPHSSPGWSAAHEGGFPWHGVSARWHLQSVSQMHKPEIRQRPGWGPKGGGPETIAAPHLTPTLNSSEAQGVSAPRRPGRSQPLEHHGAAVSGYLCERDRPEELSAVKPSLIPPTRSGACSVPWLGRGWGIGKVSDRVGVMAVHLGPPRLGPRQLPPLPDLEPLLGSPQDGQPPSHTCFSLQGALPWFGCVSPTAEVGVALLASLHWTGRGTTFSPESRLPLPFTRDLVML